MSHPNRINGGFSPSAYISETIQKLVNQVKSMPNVGATNAVVSELNNARNMLITGSFNFTKSVEEKTAENLLILKGNKSLMESYAGKFEAHRDLLT